jgi:hypothetical protein
MSLFATLTGRRTGLAGLSLQVKGIGPGHEYSRRWQQRKICLIRSYGLHIRSYGLHIRRWNFL